MPTIDVIKQFIAKELLSQSDPGALGNEDPLIESGIIDSFGIMSLIAFVEKEFGIHLESDELVPDNFETIAAIGRLVDRKRGVPGGTA